MQFGDIVTFIDNNNVITHRIIDETEVNGVMEYTTKGDANNVEDKDKITIEQIQGKVMLHIKGIGKVTEFLQKPQGLALLVGIPILLISLTKFYDVRAADRKSMRKQQRIAYMEARG